MKLLITGISGYVGKVLLPYLLKDEDVNSIIGLDVKEPDFEYKKLSFKKVDIRSPEIIKYFQSLDIVVHLAFIVSEIKDKKLIYDINVRGTKNLLDAVRRNNVKKLIIASSVAAYGSHPHPELITEDTPLRGNKDSYYSHTKVLVEEMVDEFEKENRGIIVTRLRPAILCGANCNNFFLNLLQKRILFYPKGNTEGLLIAHEDDVARAFYIAIKKDVSGAFNITTGNLSVQDISNILNIPAIGIPYFILKPLADILFKMGRSSFSSHWLVLGKYPFIISNEKAKDILGWQPKYKPIDAFKEMVNPVRYGYLRKGQFHLTGLSNGVDKWKNR